MAAVTARRKVKLPTDANGHPILALQPQETVTIAFTDVAAVNSTAPITAEVVRLHATAACYVKFGDVTTLAATTGDMYLEANKPELFSIQGHKYISAIRSVGNGSLLVTVMI